MKKRFLIPLTIALTLSIFYSFDRIYYSDKVPWLCPIRNNGGEILIRNDAYGDGQFGAKRRNGRQHKGLDILAPSGTPVRAAKGGWAISGRIPYGYGKFVKIAHSPNLISIYAHLKDVNVRWIKRVRQGDIIGTVGKSGNAGYRLIRPHLHFEIRKYGVPQDPMTELSK